MILKVTIYPVFNIEQYPIQYIEDLFASLAGWQQCIKVDVSHAYLQMWVHDQSMKFLTYAEVLILLQPSSFWDWVRVRVSDFFS